MDVITNKEVNVYLDNEKGTLCLTGMLVGTMVFLYDSQGELKRNIDLPCLHSLWRYPEKVLMS